jgi:hypothetical protein
MGSVAPILNPNSLEILKTLMGTAMLSLQGHSLSQMLSQASLHWTGKRDQHLLSYFIRHSLSLNKMHVCNGLL